MSSLLPSPSGGTLHPASYSPHIYKKAHPSFRPPARYPLDWGFPTCIILSVQASSSSFLSPPFTSPNSAQSNPPSQNRPLRDVPLLTHGLPPL